MELKILSVVKYRERLGLGLQGTLKFLYTFAIVARPIYVRVGGPAKEISKGLISGCL